MKRAVLFAALFMLAGGLAFAQAPSTMSYQGYITDLTGTPLADGNYSFTFALYTTESGGAAIWSETHPTVAVAKGLFHVILGRGTPANPLAVPFDQQYFLGISVASDPEMAPRVRLATSAYSFRARVAESVVPGSITDASVAPGAGIAASKLATNVLTESELVAGSGVTITPSGGQLTIAASPGAVTLAGDVTGPAGTNVIANDAVTTAKIADLAVTTAKIANTAVTTAKIADNAVTLVKIAPNIVSSVDGVTNNGGNIDLIAGANVTITPDDAANTITIAAAGGGGGLTLPYSQTISNASDAFHVVNTGTGNAGYFQNTNTGGTVALEAHSTSTNNNSNALYAHAAAGNAVYASSTGSSNTVYTRNSGTGHALIAGAEGNSAIHVVKNSGETGAGITVSNAGGAPAIQIDNSSAQIGLRVNQAGNTTGLFVNQTGSGNAASLEIPTGNNTTNNCLRARTYSTNSSSDALEVGAAAGNAIEGYNDNATNPTALFYNNNASATAPILQLTGSGSAYFRRNGNFETYGSVEADYFTATTNAGSVNSVGKNNITHAWARVSGSTGAIVASYGISGVSKTGTGAYTVTLSNAFGSANDYSVTLSCRQSAGNYTATVALYSSGSVFSVETYNGSGTQANCDFMLLVNGNR
jgi:hypothetical protein